MKSGGGYYKMRIEVFGVGAVSIYGNSGAEAPPFVGIIHLLLSRLIHSPSQAGRRGRNRTERQIIRRGNATH